MRVCDICGKGALTGYSVSHSHRRTKRRQLPNLQYKTILIEGKPTRIRICTRCLRTQTMVKTAAKKSS